MGAAAAVVVVGVAVPSVAAVRGASKPTASTSAEGATATTAGGGVAAARKALTATTGGTPTEGSSTASLGTTATTAAAGTSTTSGSTLLASPGSVGHVNLGAAVSTLDFLDKTLVPTIKSTFTRATDPGDFLWPTEEPTRGGTTLSAAEHYVTLAKADGIGVDAGHLVWDKNGHYPTYLVGDSKAQLLADLSEHIDAAMAPFAPGGQYAGTLSSWTVVNEALTYAAKPSLDTSGVFGKTLGASYIVTAFKDAKAADPTTPLCINEVEVESPGPRADAYYALVKAALAAGAPISCVGFQGHFSGAPAPNDPSYSAAAIRANLARFTALRNAQGQALTVRFTEVDVAIHDDGVHPVTPFDMERQAIVYAHLGEACAAVAGCTQFTTWGIDDGESWIGGQYTACGTPFLASQPVTSTNVACGAALLFDNALRAKSSYAALMRALGAGTDVLMTRTGGQLTGSGGSTLVGGQALLMSAVGTTPSAPYVVPYTGNYDLGLGGVPAGLGTTTVRVSVDGAPVCVLSFTAASVATAQTCGTRLTEGLHTVAYTLQSGTLLVNAATIASRNGLTSPSSHTAGSATAAGWSFTSPGAITIPLVTEQDATGELVVDARSMSGAVPNALTLAVDGTTVATHVVTSTTGLALAIPLPLVAGAHTVTISAAAGDVAPALQVTNLSYTATAAVADTDIGSNLYTAINPGRNG